LATALIPQQLSNLVEPLFQCYTKPVFKTARDDWRSPCEITTDDQFSYWRPILQSPRMSFEDFEAAIEFPLHPDLKTFYGSFWSGAIPGFFQDRAISLIQIWNPDDFERLISNLIGHYLSQKSVAPPRLTWFIATFEDGGEDIISLDNRSGEIVCETPGQHQHQVLAASLTDFLTMFTVDPLKLCPIELLNDD
jgi:SecY interacting protein Syd